MLRFLRRWALYKYSIDAQYLSYICTNTTYFSKYNLEHGGNMKQKYPKTQCAQIGKRICKYNSEHGGAAERLLSRFHQRPVLLSRLPVSSFIGTSMMCILIRIQMRTQIFTKGKSEFKNKCDDSGVSPTNNKIHRWVKIRPKQHTQETISSFPLPFWVDPGVIFSVRGKCCKTKIIPRRENLWSAIRLCYGALQLAPPHIPDQP